jgi:hypothetical protein
MATHNFRQYRDTSARVYVAQRIERPALIESSNNGGGIGPGWVLVALLLLGFFGFLVK